MDEEVKPSPNARLIAAATLAAGTSGGHYRSPSDAAKLLWGVYTELFGPFAAADTFAEGEHFLEWQEKHLPKT